MNLLKCHNLYRKINQFGSNTGVNTLVSKESNILGTVGHRFLSQPLNNVIVAQKQLTV